MAEAVERGTDPAFNICRECAETGATHRGNDGWLRHESCAREKDEWPYLTGQGRVLGANLRAYDGGKVRIIPALRHMTTRMGVRQLASRLGTIDEDYETLHPDLLVTRGGGADG